MANEAATQDLQAGVKPEVGTTQVVELVKPQQVTELCQLVSLSNLIQGEKPYYLLNYLHADGTADRTAISAGLVSTIKDIQANMGRNASLTFQRNIAGKTQWLNKATGEVKFHTSNSVSLYSVLPVTKAQETATAIKEKFALLSELGLEKRITEANTDDKMALSTLYGSMMR